MNRNLDISEDIIKGLRLLQIKERHSLTETAFNDIIDMGLSGISLYRMRKALGKLVPFDPMLVDCCINSCIAFTRDHRELTHCPECREARFKVGSGTKTARKHAAYWSPVTSLRLQYRDSTRSEALRYRHQYTHSPEYNAGGKMADVYDGLRYKSLINCGLFQHSTDVALLASTDGYQMFRQKRNDCWVVLLVNANLPPSERVKKHNLMISAMFPGPGQPKDMNSFLWPLVSELKKLEGKKNLEVLFDFLILTCLAHIQKVYSAMTPMLISLLPFVLIS